MSETRKSTTKNNSLSRLSALAIIAIVAGLLSYWGRQYLRLSREDFSDVGIYENPKVKDIHKKEIFWCGNCNTDASKKTRPGISLIAFEVVPMVGLKFACFRVYRHINSSVSYVGNYEQIGEGCQNSLTQKDHIDVLYDLNSYTSAGTDSVSIAYGIFAQLEQGEAKVIWSDGTTQDTPIDKGIFLTVRHNRPSDAHVSQIDTIDEDGLNTTHILQSLDNH